MNRILLVFKHTLYLTVVRRSFLIALILLPLFSYGSTLLMLGLQPDDEHPAGKVAELFSRPEEQKAAPVEGYVDLSGLIQALPEWIDANSLRAYPDEPAAARALADGQIDGYYLVTPDYLKTGQVISVRPDASPLITSPLAADLRGLLEYNLTGGDEQLADRLAQPYRLVGVTYLSNEQRLTGEGNLNMLVPLVVAMLFFMVMMGSSSMLLNSLTQEKENRTLELLVFSMRPFDLIAGKILALGLVGLGQTAVWSGLGLLLLKLSGRVLPLPDGFALPPGFIAWGLLFFLLGYCVYAAIMAGIGALAPGLRESSVMSTVASMPLALPMVLFATFAENPNGWIAVTLSLFPLTAPVGIMMRMSATDVPLWQLLVSAGLQAASAAALLRMVTGVFHAQNLLAGQGFSWKKVVKAVAGR